MSRRPSSSRTSTAGTWFGEAVPGTGRSPSVTAAVQLRARGRSRIRMMGQFCGMMGQFCRVSRGGIPRASGRAGALVLISFALVSCGSSAGNHLSKAQYGSRLIRDVKAIESATAILNSLTPSDSIPARRKQMNRSKHIASNAVADLASLNPPSDAARDNAAIVKGMRLSLRRFDQLEIYALAGDASKVKQIATSVGRSPEYIAAEAAVRDLKAKGYFRR